MRPRSSKPLTAPLLISRNVLGHLRAGKVNDEGAVDQIAHHNIAAEISQLGETLGQCGSTGSCIDMLVLGVRFLVAKEVRIGLPRFLTHALKIFQRIKVHPSSARELGVERNTPTHHGAKDTSHGAMTLAMKRIFVALRALPCMCVFSEGVVGVALVEKHVLKFAIRDRLCLKDNRVCITYERFEGRPAPVVNEIKDTMSNRMATLELVSLASLHKATERVHGAPFWRVSVVIDGMCGRTVHIYISRPVHRGTSFWWHLNAVQIWLRNKTPSQAFHINTWINSHADGLVQCAKHAASNIALWKSS